MKINSLVPWGRVLKVLRLMDKIQTHWELVDPNHPTCEDVLFALKHPLQPSSVKLLTPFCKDEIKWPSTETFGIMAELIPDWEIIKKDVTTNTEND